MHHQRAEVGDVGHDLRARSTVIPLCARACAYATANSLNKISIQRRRDRRLVKIKTEGRGAGADLVSSPSKVRFATPRRSRMAAASRIRSSWLSRNNPLPISARSVP